MKINREFLAAVDKSAADILRERFAQMNIDLEAFSSLRYIGIQTQHPPTDYNSIRNAVNSEIENTAVRSPRQPDVIFKAIDVSEMESRLFCSAIEPFSLLFQALNLKFSGKITEKSFNPFPEQYFTCGISC